MQSVVLDGNPLNEDEDMRLLTCVVLDGKPPDEENMMFLQCVQKAMKKRIQNVLKI